MKLSAAIDLGGTNIGVGIVREDGVLLHNASVPVEDASSPEAIISQMAKAVRLCAEEAEVEITSLEFVGIGVPGISNGEKGPVIFAPNISCVELTLLTNLKNSLDFPYCWVTMRTAPPLVNTTSAAEKATALCLC